MNLKIHQLVKGDTYRDMIRIPKDHRLDSRGRSIPEGSVRKVTINGRSRLMVLRGVKAIEGHQCGQPCAHMDDITRDYFGLKPNQPYDLDLRRVWFAELRWAWRTSEVGYRISSRIAVISLILGLAGAVLGGISLWLTQQGGSPNLPVRDQSQGRAKANPDETAKYVLQTLDYQVNVELPRDFFPFGGGDGYLSLRMKQVHFEGNCLFVVGFAGNLLTGFANRREEYTFRIKLADAERGGVQAVGPRVTLRGVKGFEVRSVITTFSSSKGAVKEAAETHDGRSPKVELPAVDEQAAMRLSRALEEQITSCGGQPDRFAK